MKARMDNNCKNVFKNGGNEPKKEHFTRVWISLINGIEHNKGTTSIYR